jgi:hypothetical protein
MDLEALDPTFVSEALSRAPFVQIDGAFNVRDLHHTNATSMYSACTCSRNVRPAFLFRSGELSGLTGEGKDSTIVSHDDAYTDHRRQTAPKSRHSVNL